MVERNPILEPCIKCGKLPTIRKEAGNLYYAQCRCGKWNTYEHLGTTKNGAINVWNMANRQIPRIGNPRDK